MGLRLAGAVFLWRMGFSSGLTEPPDGNASLTNCQLSMRRCRGRLAPERMRPGTRADGAPTTDAGRDVRPRCGSRHRRRGRAGHNRAAASVFRASILPAMELHGGIPPHLRTRDPPPGIGGAVRISVRSARRPSVMSAPPGRAVSGAGGGPGRPESMPFAASDRTRTGRCLPSNSGCRLGPGEYASMLTRRASMSALTPPCQIQAPRRSCSGTPGGPGCPHGGEPVRIRCARSRGGCGKRHPETHPPPSAARPTETCNRENIDAILSYYHGVVSTIATQWRVLH
jgi:hypothetical protein